MRLSLQALAVALLLSGCALRPRYADFVTAKTEGREVTFLLTDAATGLPVSGAKVEVGELKSRVNVTTGADGTFKLPVEKRYLDENPVFVVTLPKGVEASRVRLAPPPAPAPAPPEAAAPTAADAGTP